MTPKLQTILNWTAVLLIVLVGVIGYLYISKSNDLDKEKLAYEQNRLALNDSIKLLKNGKEELYHKYAELSDLSIQKSLILKDRNEQILVLNKTIVQLKDIIAQGDGVYVPPADSIIKMSFKSSTSFYNYNLIVEARKVAPWHQLILHFNQIDLKSYITRNKEGIYSTYLEVPDSLRQYITINATRTVLDKDEFIYNKPTPEKFNLLVSIMASTNRDLVPGIGARYSNSAFLYGYNLKGSSHFLQYVYYLW